MANDDAKKLVQLIERMKVEVEREVGDRLPRRVGTLAVQHIRQNFRDSGFRDGGLRAWQKSKRELAGGKTASARHKTLTSARNHLMSSTQYKPGRGEVVIENPVPYATIHNEGGVMQSSPAVTARMRKFAWAMVYKLSGKRKSSKTAPKGKRRKAKPKPLPPEAQKWKALALTKKTMLRIRAKMPKRQFMGESKELSEIINKEIADSLERINQTITTQIE